MIMCKFGAFVGGACAGALVALLFTPETGPEMRSRIKEVLKKYGVAGKSAAENVDEIAAELAAELKNS